MKLLQMHSEIDRNRIAITGHSYGAFIATHLAIKYPDTYNTLALTNPIVNLAAMAITSSVPDWVWQMLGKNFSGSGDVTDIYIDAWNR